MFWKIQINHKKQNIAQMYLVLTDISLKKKKVFKNICLTFNHIKEAY